MWKRGGGSAPGRTLSRVEGDGPKVVSKPALSTAEGGQSSGEGNGNGRLGTSNIIFHTLALGLDKVRFECIIVQVGCMIVQDCTKEGQS